ncbi:MAG: FeoC-like transcriptional regulator [Zoogloeaceae bacterium]|jgi:hypothetical protein|nr:FeoC-like transcriptional regulator [Zoogloeaceae bacterium]
MTPSALRDYLREKGPSSLIDLAAHFGVGVGFVEEVLAYWRRKGNILETVASCGKACTDCSANVVFYQWNEIQK